MARAAVAKTGTSTPDEALVRRWIANLDTCESWQRDYLDRCKRIIRRYKNEVSVPNAVASTDRRFAVLWSNIQTLGPAIYARTPNPIVSRRFRDADPIGRAASEILERALAFSMDQYDFAQRMESCRDDFLLVGRGQIWVRYIPHMAPGQPQQGDDEAAQVSNSTDGEGAADQIAYQETICDHVAYNDWGLEPCRTWDETSYVWRRVYMSRVELVERFGAEIGNAVSLDWSPKNESADDQAAKERQKKAAVYEIWDKPSGKALWVSKGYTVGPLDVRPDPLGLTEFFPCPRPLMGTLAPDTYLPIPDYVYYQDQAEEIDELTMRIGTLTDALKMVGIYAAEYKGQLAQMFVGSNNDMIPIETMAGLSEKGGLKGIVEWLPVDMVIQVLEGCFNTRKQILDDIYQITGISDILRGATDPNETATAQGIKTQWGSLRVRDRQKDIERFARDVLRLKAQIIASKFTTETLSAMTDVQLLTAQQKQQLQIAQKLDAEAQAQFAQAQQQPPQPAANVTPFPGQPPPQAPPQQPPPSILQHLISTGQLPPNAVQLASKPSWEDVDGLLKNNAMRSFRVEVETDSTIEPDEQQEKAGRIEFVQAIGQLMAQAIPLVQQIPQMAPLMAETIKFVARGFHVGAEMEDVIETTFDKLAQMQPQQPQGQSQGMNQAQAQVEQGKLQLAAQDQQVDMQKNSMDAQLAQAKLALEQQELQSNERLMQMQAQLDAAKLQAEQQRTQADIQLGLGDQDLRWHEAHLRRQEARPPVIGPNGGLG